MRKYFFLFFLSFFGVHAGLYAQTSTNLNPLNKKKTNAQNANMKGPLPKGIELVHASEGEVFLGQQNGEDSLFFQGGVIARLQDIEIRADVLKIQSQSGDIYAQGEVGFKRGEEVLSGSQLFYNIKEERGIFYNANGVLQSFYVQGEKTYISKGGNNVLLEDIFLTTNLTLNPEFYFTAKKIWFYENQQIVAIGLTYYVGGVPVFYLPVLFQTDLGTGILTAYGYNSLLGHHFHNTYYFSILPAKKGFFSQISSRLTFDYYQFNGFLFGAYFKKRSPLLNYTFDFALADHKEKALITEKNYDFRYTNLILQKDGSYKENHSLWWKMKMDLNTTLFRNSSQDQDFTVSLALDHYRHKNFESEFGYRVEPQNTIEMFKIYQSASFPSDIESLSWSLTLNKTWKNSYLTFHLQRDWYWYDESDRTKSRYKPLYEITPKLEFAGTYLLKKSGSNSIDGPIFSEVFVRTQTQRYFAEGSLQKSIFSYNLYSRFYYYLYFLPWLKATPALGLGSQMSISTEKNSILQKELDRESYEYVFSELPLYMGIPYFHTQITHLLKYSFADFGMDELFAHMRSHQVKLEIGSEVGDIFTFSSFISRDLRKYPYAVEEVKRWSPWQTDFLLHFDFINALSKDYGNIVKYKRENYLELVLSDSFVFNTFYKRPQRNEISLLFRMGGYEAPLIKKLLNFQFGITLFSNFLTQQSSYLSFNWELDILLHRFWRLKFGASSLARRFEIYRKGAKGYVPFWQDTLNSLNIFQSRDLKKGNFNLQNIFVTIEHDLHHWVLQLSYELNANVDYFGANNKSKILFYEHSIYFSIRMKQFPTIGYPYGKIYSSDSGASSL